MKDGLCAGMHAPQCGQLLAFFATSLPQVLQFVMYLLSMVHPSLFYSFLRP